MDLLVKNGKKRLFLYQTMLQNFAIAYKMVYFVASPQGNSRFHRFLTKQEQQLK